MDIRCSKDGFYCNGCPIQYECDNAEINNFVDLWEIYNKGIRQGARILGERLLEYDKSITKEDILDELMFFKEYDEED